MKKFTGGLWATMVSACLLAGCGGSSDSVVPTTAVPPRTIVAAEKIQAPDDRRLLQLRATRTAHGKDMAGYAPIGNNSYANASLKFLISAIGPQRLVAHLENFSEHTPDPTARIAAQKFIELINKTYQSKDTLRNEVKELTDVLQTLAPFNKVNEHGGLAFRLDEAQTPSVFLDLLAKAFQLDTLPGWSLDIKDTLVQDNEVLIEDLPVFNGHLYRIAPLNILAHSGVAQISLQGLVDLIQTHIDTWSTGASPGAPAILVRMLREARVADADSFTRLTVLPATADPASAPLMDYRLDDRAVLRVLDLTTGKPAQLTLRPNEQLIFEDGRYQLNLRNTAGQWEHHDDDVVADVPGGRRDSVLHLLNLGVLGRAQAE